MSGQGDDRSGDGIREQRLKTALRDNLKRRKAQVRAREMSVEGIREAEAPDDASPEPPVDRTAEDGR